MINIDLKPLNKGCKGWYRYRNPFSIGWRIRNAMARKGLGTLDEVITFIPAPLDPHSSSVHGEGS